MGTIHYFKTFLSENFDNLNTPLGRRIDIAIIMLIALSSIIFIILTYPLGSDFRRILELIDAIILIIFTLEYIIRYWLASKKIKHITSLYSIIDLIAILPLYIGLLADLGFLVILRTFRILRLIRFIRGRRLLPKASNEEAYVLLNIVFTVFSIIFIFSGLFYFTEHKINPEVVGTFFDAVYFSVVTMSTVGFGDITPISSNGKFVTMLMILSAIILIPWQISVFLKNLMRTTTKIKVTCKNCGLQHHDKDATYCKDCGNMIYNPDKKD
jgi:voltage-gated potassium channel